MNASDIAALMKGVAPAIRDLVAAAAEPLVARIAELEQMIETERAAAPDMIAVSVAAAVAKLPLPEPGKDADPALVAQMVADAVGSLPPPAPGKDADPEVIRSMVAEEVAKLPPAENGKDADLEVTAELVRTLVAEAVAAIPPAQDGRSVSVDDVLPAIEERLPALISEAVAAIPVPKDGEPGKEGPPGKLPVAKEWTDDVTYEGEVRTFGGATYQALRDTAKEPPHEDWICLAAAGRAGKDADEIDVRGTFDERAEYRRLNIVALNGAAFIARKDDPGPCPGEGWQVIAMRGKPGPPGESRKGDPGKRGEAGPAVAEMSVDGEGLLTLVNADGTRIECDLYPVLAKVSR